MSKKAIWNSIKVTPVNTSVMFSYRPNSYLSRKLTGFAIKYILKNTCNHVVVNPRYFENVFILDQVNRLLTPPARLLDIGSAESELPLYLHASGFDITAFDQRDYPFVSSICGDAIKLMDYIDTHSFDAITAVSTIEHIGIGAYGDHVRTTTYSQLLNTWKQGLKEHGYIIITLPVTSETKRREKGQWVENLAQLKEIITGTSGIIKSEKLIVQNHSLPMQWEETEVGTDKKFSLGVYMASIQY